MSPGMTVWKIPAGIGSPSAAVQIGFVNQVLTNQSFRFSFSVGNELNANDIIIIKQSQDNDGSLYARTKFGNSIRQLYIDAGCTQKWQPPVNGKFYVIQTQTDQNMKGIGVADSLSLGKVSNNPLYCMNLDEKGKVSLLFTGNADVKFNVQTCWDAGLFTDLESTYVNIRYAGAWYQGIWTTKNYNETTYRNGDPILEVTNQVVWDNATFGAYCNYNNDPTDSETYGKLYNLYASIFLAPYGWHIPSGFDWANLYYAVQGGFGIAGGPPFAAFSWREIGSSHWPFSTSPPSTDSFKFCGIGNGMRTFAASGGFIRKNVQANYWTSDYGFFTTGGSRYRRWLIGSDGGDQNFVFADDRTSIPGTEGYSVRFLKDNLNTPGVYGRPLIQYLGVWDYTTVLDNG